MITMMLAVLILILIFVIDPVRQLDKMKDTQRLHDLFQVKNALDVYYNDHNCYPAMVPFGQEWKEGNTIYMKKVPQDPDCTPGNPNRCYVYVYQGEEPCPQWNVLYSRKSYTEERSYSCSLPPGCVPPNFGDPGYNSCFSSGRVDCSYISTNPLPTPGPLPTSTPTPTTGSVLTPTPTFTPTPTASCSKDYACTGGPPARCNVVPVGTGQYCVSNCEGNCP